jgi:hypothetical protein
MASKVSVFFFFARVAGPEYFPILIAHHIPAGLGVTNEFYSGLLMFSAFGTEAAWTAVSGRRAACAAAI